MDAGETPQCPYLQDGPKKRTPILFLRCPLFWTFLYITWPYAKLRFGVGKTAVTELVVWSLDQARSVVSRLQSTAASGVNQRTFSQLGTQERCQPTNNRQGWISWSPVCLAVYCSVRQSVCRWVTPFFCLLVCPSVCLSVSLLICVHLTVCLCVQPPVTQLVEDADDKLFQSVLHNPEHTVYQLLPELRHDITYSLRPRRLDLTLSRGSHCISDCYF